MHMAIVVLSVLLTLLFGFTGTTKVFNTTTARNNAAHLGISAGLSRMIGAAEVEAYLFRSREDLRHSAGRRGVGVAAARWTRRCSTMRAPPKDTITQVAECLLRRADRDRPREFGIHESDGAPDEKEGRPKHQPPGYQACMMAQ
jgi:hypothetical protein